MNPWRAALVMVLAITTAGIRAVLGATPSQPRTYDIHPKFEARVGAPDPALPGTLIAESTYGENPPASPHYVAVDEVIHFIDESWDKDLVPDGQSSGQNDPINQRWWFVNDNQEKYTAQETDTAFDCLIENPGQFIVKGKAEDDSPVVTKDDKFLWWSSMRLYALGLEYIALRPGSGATIQGDEIVIDIASLTSAQIDGHGYNYTYTATGGDGQRCYDDLGRPMTDQWGQPLPQDDVEIAAAYNWSFSPTQLGYVQPPTDCTWTRLFHHNMTGRGVLTATYTKRTPNVTVSVPVKFVKSDCFIELTGINYDEVQNVPINGKAPTDRDGTGNVGQMKAKVVIEAEPNTDYSISVSDDSSKLDIVGAPTWLATDGQGRAEQEFEIHAIGTEPSASADEITITASLRPYGGGDALASTEEKLCVYVFGFASLGEPLDQWWPHSGLDHEAAAGGSFKVWTGSGPGGALCYSGIRKQYRMNVETVPAASFAGTARAKAVVTAVAKGHAVLTKGFLENGLSLGISATVEIVTISVGMTGPKHVAATGMDVAIGFNGGPYQEKGDWGRDTNLFNVPLGWPAKTEVYDLNSYPITKQDDEREYTLPGDGFPLDLYILFGAETTKELDPPGPIMGGAEVHSDSWWQLLAGDTVIEEWDGVYEIQ